MSDATYKLGRLPARFPGGLYELSYYVAGPLPIPPTSIPLPKVTNWGMLGNDQYGDCGPAGFIHGCEADAAITHQKENWPTAQEVINGYLAYTHGQDAGVVLSDFLSYVRMQPKGFCGHKLTAYAPINHLDTTMLRTAIWMYDFIYTGIAVTDAMMQAAQLGQPWTLADLHSPVVGGHCVPVVAYDEHWLYLVTWGSIQKVSYPMWSQICDEAWVVITEEFVKAGGDWHGVSLKALEADLNRLG